MHTSVFSAKSSRRALRSCSLIEPTHSACAPRPPVAEDPPKPLMDRVPSGWNAPTSTWNCDCRRAFTLANVVLIKTVASMITGLLASTHMTGRQQVADCFLHSDSHEAEYSSVCEDSQSCLLMVCSSIGEMTAHAQRDSNKARDFWSPFL